MGSRIYSGLFFRIRREEGSVVGTPTVCPTLSETPTRQPGGLLPWLLRDLAVPEVGLKSFKRACVSLCVQESRLLVCVTVCVCACEMSSLSVKSFKRGVCASG